MMTVNTRFRKLFPFALLLVLGVFISWIAYYNEIWEGGGDNPWHYYFSRYAPTYPKYFLHHWGKPVFILFSTCFSQFGFYGLNIFNILCGLGSAYVTYKYCRLLNYTPSWFAILLVLFGPVYFLVLQTGLTEPLFSLLLISTSYLLFKEKYIAATIIGSMLMYSRTEGIFIILLFAFYLLITSKWKYIPLLGFSFIIYSLIGKLAGKDFLWFFTENPYKAASVYGHGPWNYFFKRYDYIFGLPHLILMLSGIALLIFAIFKNKEVYRANTEKKHLKIFFLVFIPAFCFFFFHVYAWAMGKFASAGLERVMAGIIPLTTILCMHTIHYLYNFSKNRYLQGAVWLVIGYFIISATFKNYSYPLKTFGSEAVERKASEWFKQYRKPNSIIYYAHVSIVFYCDYDPFSEENKECFSFPSDWNLPKDKTIYYVWDSGFTVQSCNMKLEDLARHPEFKQIKEFGDKEFNIKFFELNPSSTASPVQ
ncbi:MAG: hypothetical protein U0073_15120 [Bacteroidia bacterium]